MIGIVALMVATNVMFHPSWSVQKIESNRVYQIENAIDTTQPFFHVDAEQYGGAGFRLRWKANISDQWQIVDYAKGDGHRVFKVYIDANSKLYKDMVESNAGFFEMSPMYVVRGTESRSTIFRIDMKGFFPKQPEFIGPPSPFVKILKSPPIPGGGTI